MYFQATKFDIYFFNFQGFKQINTNVKNINKWQNRKCKNLLKIFVFYFIYVKTHLINKSKVFDLSTTLWVSFFLFFFLYIECINHKGYLIRNFYPSGFVLTKTKPWLFSYCTILYKLENKKMTSEVTFRCNKINNISFSIYWGFNAYNVQIFAYDKVCVYFSLLIWLLNQNNWYKKVDKSN